MKTSAFRHSIRIVLGLAAAFGLLLGSGQAEEPNPKKPAPAPTNKKPKKEKTIAITGSRIPQKTDRLGAMPTTHFPVVIISMQSIERTGRVTPGGVLGTQPYVR